MSKETYPFSEDYQLKLVAKLITNGTNLIIDNLINPQHLENPALIAITTTTLDLYKKYCVPVTVSVVEERLRADGELTEDVEQTLKKIRKIRLEEIEDKYISDQVTRFARIQAFKNTMLESVGLLETNNLEAVEEAWQKALMVGRSGTSNIGVFYFSSLSDRIQKRLQRADVLPTLIPEIDEVLADGGFGRQELSVFLGQPNVGKSFALYHMARSAIIQKKRTVIYTLEMSPYKIGDRIDAAISGIEINDLKNNSEEVSKHVRRWESKYGDILVMKDFPSGGANVNTLRMHMATLRLSGFNPEVVIVDYINLLKPINEADNRYEGLGAVYVELRGLAQTENVWLISAGQANRHSTKDNPIIDLTGIAESFQGAMHSDIIITMNQLEQEYLQGRMRLFIAKNRYDVKDRTIPINTNMKKGALFRNVFSEVVEGTSVVEKTKRNRKNDKQVREISAV